MSAVPDGEDAATGTDTLSETGLRQPGQPIGAMPVEGGVDALTADGAIVRIRPVRLDDAAALTDLHERASDDTLYRRFLSTGHHPIAGEVARLVRAPGSDHVALVAVERGRLIGVCSYEVLPGGLDAEFAVFVDDTAHGRGIGSLLLEHLAVYGRRHGIPDLLGEILPSNSPMLHVASGLGQPIRSAFDLGLIEVHLDTTDTGNDVLDRRDLAAARRSLGPLFAPGCVAVFGADHAAGGLGGTVVQAMLDGGFTGTVYAVDPGGGTVAGARSYPTLADAPIPPDLIIVAEPSPGVAGIIAEAGAAGARVAVVLSAGFGDAAPDGPARRRDLVRAARAAGVRLLGPESLGVLNTDPAVRLHATVPVTVNAGGLAVASQSGAVGISLLSQAATAGVGVSSFVSLGDKADVSGNDLLSYWFDDPATTAIALHLESVGNPRRFARIARTVARRKPVLVVKSRRISLSENTASGEVSDATVDALFAQAGVIRCDGLGDLMNTARLLIDQPLPLGDRIAIVGNTGGIITLCADVAATARLTQPALPDEVYAAIKAVAPGAEGSNPIDLGGDASDAAIAAAILAVAPHVDAVVAVVAATGPTDMSATVSAIGAVADTVGVPVAVLLISGADLPAGAGSRNVPIYRLPEDAIGALARSMRYARWRSAPVGVRPHLDGVDAVRARTLVSEALATGGGWQASNVCGAILACYGIPITAGREVDSADAAITVATGFGFPAVLKSADPTLTRKNDIGAVRLNLADGGAVEDAYRGIVTIAKNRWVLVQRQARAGVELTVGVVHDSVFGSVLTCAMGGIAGDLLGDRSVRLLPVTDRDVAKMWQELRIAPLLSGYRGGQPLDTVALEDLLLRLGRLADDHPQIADLDVDPVIITPTGITIVDVKLRIASVGTEPDAGLRCLREPR